MAPRTILLPCAIDDGTLFAKMLEQNYNKRTKILVPQRGNNAQLVALANKNAQEEVNRVTDKNERINATIHTLAKMLGLDNVHRIESYDISNISGTDTVASMVVFQDGKSQRSEYKRFKIRELSHQDDYAAMAEVLRRRFEHYLNADTGFIQPPDLLLIDGGVSHAMTAVNVLTTMGLNFPVFGMVKDDRHRTRALVTPNGMEIRIDNQQSVFALIGNIQEETHRFAIGYHRKLRSKRMRYSELDAIAGVGTKRKQELLKIYKSIAAISEADLADLQRHLPRNVALSVFQHFHNKEQ
jgi:excinuclease ABC subunit C